MVRAFRCMARPRKAVANRHAADQDVQDVAAHCHEAENENVPDAARDIPAGDCGCDNCAICHLATAGYLPVTAVAMLPLADSILIATPLNAASSHFPDPPQHPPRRLN